MGVRNTQENNTVPAVADFELSLRAAPGGGFLADVRLTRPNTVVPVELVTGVPVSIDVKALLAVWNEPDAYGQRISSMLFADVRLLKAWAEAVAVTFSVGQNLRFRLRLDVGADALHALRWETIRDPTTGSPLAMNQRYLFSRYLDSPDFIPALPLDEVAPRALVVVASPSDLGLYKLPAFDVEGEVTRARLALRDMSVTALSQSAPGSTTSVQATVRALQVALHRGVHVLYILCHGQLRDGQTYLWLERENGTTDIVSGQVLLDLIQQLEYRPLLVVLASCQSAGKSHADRALAALGPRLARAGVPAIIAMQGDISARSVKKFMPVLFQELRQDGRIDRALSVARSALSDQPDWWAPILFLRNPQLRLWRSDERVDGMTNRARFEAPDRGADANKDRFDDAQSQRPLGELPFHQASASFHALAQLMPHLPPDVRDAIAIYQTNFETYRHQIELLNDYKHLHDELQQMDDEYELLVMWCHGLQSDNDAIRWGLVVQLESRLYLRLGELLAYVRKTTFFDEATIWTTPLDTIRVNLHGACQRYDAEQFGKTINLLKPIIAEQLGATDTSLKEAAKTLRLSTLATSLEKIHDQLQHVAGAAPDRIVLQQLTELLHGVKALNTLDGELSRSITLHTRFQRFDNKLRLAAGLLTRSIAEMSDVWSIIQQMMVVISQGTLVEELPQLRKLELELDRAIALNEEQPIRSLFNEYRSQVRQIFNRIDRNLLDLCAKLKQIGEPLDGVLRIMRPPT